MVETVCQRCKRVVTGRAPDVKACCEVGTAACRVLCVVCAKVEHGIPTPLLVRRIAAQR